jgi:hypothetical protein
MAVIKGVAQLLKPPTKTWSMKIELNTGITIPGSTRASPTSTR